MIQPERIGLEPEPFILALVTLVAMAWLVWREVATFMIDPDTLTTVWVGAFTLVLLTGDPANWSAALAMGCIAAALTDIARLWQPVAIGQGDIRMMGLVGFLAGPDHAVPAFCAFGGLCLLTSAGYSIIRSKRLSHVVFPVTIAGMGAAALALALRLNDLAGWMPLPGGYEPLRQAAYQFPPLLLLAAILLAIALGFIALNRKRVGLSSRAAP